MKRAIQNTLYCLTWVVTLWKSIKGKAMDKIMQNSPRKNCVSRDMSNKGQHKAINRMHRILFWQIPDTLRG